MSRSFFCLQLQETFFDLYLYTYKIINLFLFFKNVNWITIFMTLLYCLNWFSLRVLKTFTNYNFTMNEPRIPLYNKDWNDIDIFLFSNGQQYSPPRKYHLRSDELEFWEATMLCMAQTQFGPISSNMELYTLDGKKIDSPLELIDANSYVAVKPPDAFIPGGYEQYLIKASRSWEKRQEKLNNVADVTGEINSTKDQEYSKSAIDEFKANDITNIQNPKNIMEKDFDSNSTNNTIISRLRKETDRSLEEKQREYKPFVNRKSTDGAKSKIMKINQHNSKDDSILNKKINISVPKNFKNSSSRKPSILTKSDRNNLKTNSFNHQKEKIQPNLTKSPDEIEVKERNDLSKPYHNENQSRKDSNVSSDKDLLISSAVYKNPDSESQSVYMNAERKTIQREDLYKDNYKSPELHKIDEINDELESSQKDHKAISVQSITCNNKNRPEICTSFASRAKVFNINLNIEIRDDRDSTDTERNDRLEKCKSCTEFFTAEQESQTNNNIYLNDEDLKFENSMPRRKSLFSDKAYSNRDVGVTKVIIVKCTCGEAQNINNNSKENYTALVPSTVADKNYESSTCRSFNTQLADRDVFKTRHSILNTVPQNLRNKLISRESSQVTIKHKVSICPDSPIKISEDLSYSIKKYALNGISDQKVDKFTQTEWCNILLQAQPQANGHYLFYLPPLHVLAQYNLL